MQNGRLFFDPASFRWWGLNLPRESDLPQSEVSIGGNCWTRYVQSIVLTSVDEKKISLTVQSSDTSSANPYIVYSSIFSVLNGERTVPDNVLPGCCGDYMRVFLAHAVEIQSKMKSQLIDVENMWLGQQQHSVISCFLS